MTISRVWAWVNNRKAKVVRQPDNKEINDNKLLNHYFDRFHLHVFIGQLAVVFSGKRGSCEVGWELASQRALTASR